MWRAACSNFVVRSLLVFLAFVTSAAGQRVSAGVKLGAVLTDTFQGAASELSDESKRYTVGPSVEVRLFKALSVEVDALYRHIGFDHDRRSNPVRVYTRERDASWEFPILAKYRVLPKAAAVPFAVAGYAPRVVNGSGFQRLVSSPFPLQVAPTYDTSYGVTHGFVAGGGVEFRAWKLRLVSEARYTRWNRSFYQFSFGATQNTSTQNQAEVLLGIHWP